ncbi:hypothetical protein Taro_040538 [Colocasia esculenta]|uniref:Uncharacterized protein n=1 Tax=Colocasia esculenta TaxID=4460 RepID=A0A843WJ04_COLES|nr:hypothetical protein [Colocasia esculenta]
MAGVDGLGEGTLPRQHIESVLLTRAMIWNLMNGRATSTMQDQFKRDLVECVSEAVEAFAKLRVIRSVMVPLRETGYKVEICKSRWERGSRQQL